MPLTPESAIRAGAARANPRKSSVLRSYCRNRPARPSSFRKRFQSNSRPRLAFPGPIDRIHPFAIPGPVLSMPATVPRRYHFLGLTRKVCIHRRLQGMSGMTAGDFLKCLETGNAFPKPPNGLRVMQLIDRMESTGLLVRPGYGNRSSAGMGDHYLHLPTKWDERRKHFRYAAVLRPEFLYHLFAQGLVHITGTVGECRDAAAGTLSAGAQQEACIRRLAGVPV